MLTGIKVVLNGNSFSMAAADGFRLAVHYGHLEEAVENPVDIIVPARTMNEVVRLLGDQEEAVEVVVNSSSSQVLFRLKGTELISQLVQGTFPNFDQLIPQTHTARATVGHQEFLRAVRTAAIFARDGSGIIRLEMRSGEDGQGQICLSARAEERGEHEGEIEATVEGDIAEAKIAFNSRYLLDALGAMEKGKVSLEMTSSASPGVFKPGDAQDYIHVVMPMFVQW